MYFRQLYRSCLTKMGDRLVKRAVSEVEPHFGSQPSIFMITRSEDLQIQVLTIDY